MSIILASTLVIFSVFGILQFSLHDNTKVSFINSSDSHFSKTANAADRINEGLLQGEAGRKPPVDGQKDRSDSLMKFFICILGTLMVPAGNSLIIMIITAMVFVLLKKENPFCRAFKEVFRPPGMEYYNRRRLNFVTPLEKCILNRADIYDINPISKYGWGMYPFIETRALAYSGRARVFFMAKL
ncbi:MAG: hypothetical protein ABIH89_01290 [Elusimicrobiota bacterium]